MTGLINCNRVLRTPTHPLATALILAILHHHHHTTPSLITNHQPSSTTTMADNNHDHIQAFKTGALSPIVDSIRMPWDTCFRATISTFDVSVQLSLRVSIDDLSEIGGAEIIGVHGHYRAGSTVARSRCLLEGWGYMKSRQVWRERKTGEDGRLSTTKTRTRLDVTPRSCVNLGLVYTF